jgi:tRNA A37 methylthiotransferase MiaB
MTLKNRYKNCAIFQNGCESVLFDLETVKTTIVDTYGVEIVHFDKAELVFFFGCTFSAQKEAETIQIIEGLLKENAKQIVVSGCYLREYYNDPRVKFVKLANLNIFISGLWNNSKHLESGLQRTKLSPVVAISHGCFGKCAFCSVKTVKGIHKSRAINEILNDIGLRMTNSRMVKLVAEEVAGFGIDCGLSLKVLVDRIIAQYPDIELKFGSLNPRLLSRFSYEELAIFAYPAVIGNIHIPIQSASNRILSLMQRGYTGEEFRQVYSSLKELGVKAISTDIICGFPTEETGDHNMNIDLLQELPFEFVQIFAYQERPGTLAAEMEQIEVNIREYRTTELISYFLKHYAARNSLSLEQLILDPRVFNTNINFN